MWRRWICRRLVGAGVDWCSNLVPREVGSYIHADVQVGVVARVGAVARGRECRSRGRRPCRCATRPEERGSGYAKRGRAAVSGVSFGGASDVVGSVPQVP